MHSILFYFSVKYNCTLHYVLLNLLNTKKIFIQISGMVHWVQFDIQQPQYFNLLKAFLFAPQQICHVILIKQAFGNTTMYKLHVHIFLFDRQQKIKISSDPIGRIFVLNQYILLQKNSRQGLIDFTPMRIGILSKGKSNFESFEKFDICITFTERCVFMRKTANLHVCIILVFA